MAVTYCHYRQLLNIADRLSATQITDLQSSSFGLLLVYLTKLDEEFAHYLNIEPCSLFENANILVVLKIGKVISDIESIYYLEELDKLARKLTKVSKYLLNDNSV